MTRDTFGDGLGRLRDLLEGEATIASLASTLRSITGRMVVDKTGLSGSYALSMNFDMIGSRRGPDVATTPSPDEAPTVFTAIVDQLGLRLRSTTAEAETLVIDRLERPTPN